MRISRAVYICAIATLGMTGAAGAQDAAAGARLFTAKCQACHQLDPAKGSGMGPNLAGVIGRKSAALPGFNYSPAMKGANLVWDNASLDAYLKAPQAAIKGNRMTFAGIADAPHRADLIAFLATKN
ncbi:cytochrome c family protein [Niveispirillum cyanobacteriorum]|uniref:Cytochrome c domain-containing protein n=3 Tax=Azospirillaceae TaxID=2829815 RepID=A0A255Z6L4_9PROT|nr:cytochrome c family protein [Niveispirillum cyanobacteriorum]OYQ37072.1 hypothetical protein CHU95_02545 [Niveispirillum lacus]GGE87971.1 cytochrome c [Niveispirillum cyanobacteriorum]